jgi:hypothetical protein
MTPPRNVSARVTSVTPEPMNLVDSFINADVKTSAVEEIARTKVPANFRATIRQAVIMSPSDSTKQPYVRLCFKAGGYKTISLMAPTCFNVCAGQQLDIKTLEFVTTSKDGNEYLNIDGEVL